MSLKNRIALLTLAVFLLGIWSLTLLISSGLREDMVRLIGEQQFSTVSTVAAQIDAELEDRLNALVLIAGGVTPAMIDDQAELQRYLQRHTLFQQLFNGGVRISDTHAATLATVPYTAQRIGTSYADRDYMQAALKDGRVNIGRPVIGKVLQSPVLGLAAPIRDSQGRVIGAVVGVIDLGKPSVFDKIVDSRYGKTGGYLVLAPQHDLIVTATDKSYVMTPMPTPGRNKSHDLFVSGYEGYNVASSSRGRSEISAARQIPAAGWLLIGVLPTDEAFVPIDNMQRRMLLASLLFSLLAGLLTWWIVRRMLRKQFAPVLLATQRIHDMAHPAGSELQPLPVAQRDEFGQLLGSFNQLIESVAQREARLSELSVTDSLTGLANRRHLNDVLSSEWARAGRSGQGLAVLMVDVDLFKNYNDHYGHQAGDACLIRVAHVLQEHARRAGDLAARYGGEEFVVISADCDATKGRMLAETLRGSVENLAQPHAESPYGKVTISIGVAAMKPDVSGNPENILRLADKALYKAKHAGRNRVELIEVS